MVTGLVNNRSYNKQHKADTKPRYSLFGIRYSSLNGFTLLEILISIAILSVVLTALYNTFFLSHKALAAVDGTLLKLQESRAFVDILKREIESVFYSPDNSFTVFSTEDRDFFGRQASRLTITSFSSSIDGVAKINYNAEERDGRLIITKEIISAFSQPDLSQPSGNYKVDMLEDMESFALECRYGNKWVKTWDSTLTKDVPDEVKISVTFFIANEDIKDKAGRLFIISDIAKPRIGKYL
ncbi:MAG: prepilin-type N-terminal cleavage/methylation domain-containing protein [Proteobacteria bacterium]|nr:prepilin-type N-terminal cleavage/methylation domain-containing protein [Pseudomonadota bacterium]MBU4011219.1 prepilin-type N-terminal cleavage/methylation domain-containing protein [Pseudomonadota bacterium]